MTLNLLDQLIAASCSDDCETKDLHTVFFIPLSDVFTLMIVGEEDIKCGEIIFPFSVQTWLLMTRPLPPPPFKVQSYKDYLFIYQTPGS